MRRSQIKATLAVILILMAQPVLAQESAKMSSESNQEAQAGSSAVTNNSSNENNSAAGSKSEAQAVTAPVQATSEVIIINPPVEKTVEQPTTVVNASPLKSSEADNLRKAREDAEIETEQKIVEKLEKSRLEDEQKRLDKLFKGSEVSQEAKADASAPAAAGTTVVVEPSQNVGDNSQATQTIKIEAGSAAQSDAQAVTAAPQAAATEESTAVAAPVVAPVVVEEASSAESSVRAELKEVSEEAREAKKNKMSVGGALYSMDYPESYNTASDFGAGVTLGWESSERLGVEAAFVYSQHNVDDSYSLFKQVDQYNWMVTGRYSILPYRITPVVGAVVSYTRREYTDMYAWGYSSFSGAQSASSDSFDAGVLVGVDFKAGRNLSLGLEYRYMTNLNSRYDDPEAFNRSIYDVNNRYYQTLEDIDYDLIGFSMKFMF